MAIRRFKPTSPGRRHGSVLVFKNEITCTEPEKSLLESQRRTGGRNSYGRMTSRRRGVSCDRWRRDAAVTKA